MEDHIGAAYQRNQAGWVDNRADREVESVVILELGNVLNAASRKIIQDENFMAALKKRLAKVAADESRAAGHQNSFHSQPREPVDKDERVRLQQSLVVEKKEKLL
jgi:hypothetical protein